MLTIGETAEQGSGVVETEAPVELLGVQHGAPVTQRLELNAGRQGERGGGAGTRAPVGESVGFLQGGDSVSVSAGGGSALVRFSRRIRPLHGLYGCDFTGVKEAKRRCPWIKAH